MKNTSIVVWMYPGRKISRIKCDCVVSLCKKYMMVHTYPRHVSLVLYVVFFCARIVSGMCMIIGRGVYQLNVSLCDDVKRGVPFPYLKSILVYLISNSSLNFFRGDTPVEVWIMSKNHQKSPKRTFWWKS